MRRYIPLGIIVAIIVVGLILLLLKTEKGETNSIKASGTIEVTEVDVSSRVAGQIDIMNVSEGDSIKENAVICELNHKELDAQLENAKAGYQAALDAVNQARIRYENIKSKLQRARNLFETGGVPKQEVDDLEAQYKILKAQYSLARQNLNQAKAGLNLIKAKLDDFIIKAPISGLVLSTNFQKGEVVFPGAPIVTLADLSTVWLKVYISEKELGRIKIGDKAKVTTDTYPNKIYWGKVVKIASEAEFTPKNIQTKEERTRLVFAIKISIPNPKQELKPGMLADAEIIIR